MVIPGQREGAAEDVLLRIDGRQPLSAELVAAVSIACDEAEDRAGRGRVVVHVSGSTDELRTDGLTIGLVTKWEKALRRLECLPALTFAVAEGPCGGTALDALLVADHRIATRSFRLMMPLVDGGTWPGMMLYRLSRQGGRTAAIRRAVLFGVPIEASDALALQLVDELTDDAQESLAAAIASHARAVGPESAIRRRLLLEAPTVGFDEALGAHLAACDRTLRG
jgi:isomerase DpgB